MCDIWKAPATYEMGVGELARHLESVADSEIEWVVLSGGEPLMHPDVFGLCALLRARGIRVTILSTGLLLARHASAIMAQVDDVIVSVDGPDAIHNLIRGVAGAWEKLAGGVRALRALRPDYPIAGRCTVQRANHGHLRETVASARAMGLDSISFLAADVRSTAFNRPEPWEAARQNEIALRAGEIPVLEAEIEALVDARECGGFVAESPEKLRRIAQHFRAQIGLAAAVAPRCNAPWVSAVLEADGTVRPCFFHAPIGKTAPGRTLADVLASPEAEAFRAGLDVASDPICRRCVCSYFRPVSPGQNTSDSMSSTDHRQTVAQVPAGSPVSSEARFTA